MLNSNDTTSDGPREQRGAQRALKSTLRKRSNDWIVTSPTGNGDSIHARAKTAWANELLCNALRHNLCVLV